MHELGLVNYAVKEVDKFAKERGVTNIKTVTLEFGEVSGIIPAYLYDYWDWYTKKHHKLEGTKLKVEEIPAVTWCDDCKTTYNTITYGKTCPRCGSDKTWLLRGSEMRIKQIEVEDSEGSAGEIDATGEYKPQQ
jgi:hydrogenase nickel incorporation protein HypA/HybF